MDIHVTRSLCILNISKKDMIVLFSVPHWEMKEVASLVASSICCEIQLCSVVFPVGFLPLHLLACIALTQDIFQIRQQNLFDVEKWLMWYWKM